MERSDAPVENSIDRPRCEQLVPKSLAMRTLRMLFKIQNSRNPVSIVCQSATGNVSAIVVRSSTRVMDVEETETGSRLINMDVASSTEVQRKKIKQVSMRRRWRGNDDYCNT
jgi:hypothetical protein